MKDVRSRLGGLEVHVKEILTLLRAKGKKAHENTNSYLNRKKRKRKEEDARRQDRQKNPEGSPFEWGAVESNRVVDHFVRKERKRKEEDARRRRTPRAHRSSGGLSSPSTSSG